jgi:hypothetical protein
MHHKHCHHVHFLSPRTSRKALTTVMNPEVFEEGERPLVAKAAKRAGTRLHRRLQESISESRMLQVLDRSLEIGRSTSSFKTPSTNRSSLDLSNQNQEEEEEEEELVCVSTMVAVEAEVAQEEPQQRVRGSVDALVDSIVMMSGAGWACLGLRCAQDCAAHQSRALRRGLRCAEGEPIRGLRRLQVRRKTRRVAYFQHH